MKGLEGMISKTDLKDGPIYEENFNQFMMSFLCSDEKDDCCH